MVKEGLEFFNGARHIHYRRLATLGLSSWQQDATEFHFSPPFHLPGNQVGPRTPEAWTRAGFPGIILWLAKFHLGHKVLEGVRLRRQIRNGLRSFSHSNGALPRYFIDVHDAPVDLFAGG